MTGTIIYFNSEKGYGFIKQDESASNMFFHVTKCNDAPELQMRVQYAVAEGRKGLEAVNVSSIE